MVLHHQMKFNLSFKKQCRHVAYSENFTLTRYLLPNIFVLFPGKNRMASDAGQAPCSLRGTELLASSWNMKILNLTCPLFFASLSNLSRTSCSHRIQHECKQADACKHFQIGMTITVINKQMTKHEYLWSVFLSTSRWEKSCMSVFFRTNFSRPKIVCH